MHSRDIARRKGDAHSLPICHVWIFLIFSWKAFSLLRWSFTAWVGNNMWPRPKEEEGVLRVQKGRDYNSGGNYWWSLESSWSCICLNFCLRASHFLANHTPAESVLLIPIGWIGFHPLDIAMDWRWCCDDISTSIRKSTWRVALANGVRFQLRARLQFLILLQVRFQLR